MLIKDLRLIKKYDSAKISAQICFEDTCRKSKEVFFETQGSNAKDLTLNPHSFLVGCMPPALFHKEKRIAIKEPICPNLLEGIKTIMDLFGHWYNLSEFIPKIEAKTLSKALPGPRQNRTGIFLSGGIDSLAALRTNRLNFPKSHPGYIQDALLIHGFDIGGRLKWGPKQHVFDRAKKAMEKVARDSDLNLIPCLTNIRHLADSRQFWIKMFFGAVLAACGHAFANRFNMLYIASSYDIVNINPCASHPIVDPEFSSYDLVFKHRDLRMTRLEKVKLISEWEAGLQNMRVCFANAKGSYNCGRCEKCVRTMAELEAVGALDKCTAFPSQTITPDMLKPSDILDKNRYLYWLEMMPALEKRGRHDLVKAIKEITAQVTKV